MPGIFKNGKKFLSISENSHKFSELHNKIIAPRLKTKDGHVLTRASLFFHFVNQSDLSLFLFSTN